MVEAERMLRRQIPGIIAIDLVERKDNYALIIVHPVGMTKVKVHESIR